MKRPSRSVRVLVVDDSPLCVDVLATRIARDPRLEVAGVAYDGLRAVELAARLRPSVITMDLHMPRLDGVAAIRRIMQESPTPILVVTSADDRSLAAFEALRHGAADLMEKPRPGDGEDALCSRIWALARARRRTPSVAPLRPVVRPVRDSATRAIGLVASTGGPAALNAILSRLPANLGAAILVVQHLPVGFAPRLARWLDTASPLTVSVAADGDRLEPGRVFLAGDEHHLTVDGSRRVKLEKGPAVNGHLPSGTRLLESLAHALGSAAAGVVLTGMGKDGADGLLAIRRAGGRTAAQDESTSVVYGMPRAAVDVGAADRVFPIELMAEHVVELAGRKGAA